MKEDKILNIGDIVQPVPGVGDVYQIVKIENETVFLKEITNLDIYTRDDDGYYRFSLYTIINTFKKNKIT